jgi:hypothetical protein
MTFLLGRGRLLALQGRGGRIGRPGLALGLPLQSLGRALGALARGSPGPRIALLGFQLQSSRMMLSIQYSERFAGRCRQPQRMAVGGFLTRVPPY